MLHLQRLRLPAFVILICAACLPGVAFAQSPTIVSVSPGAVAPGKSVDVTIRGGNLSGATQLWTSFPAKSELAPGVKNNGKNAGQVVFRVTLPQNAPVGIQGIRVVSSNGVSSLALMTVDDLPTVASTGKNTSPSTAQKITLPAAVEGAVPALGRHYYRFEAKAGETLSFEALARRIGSPLDPMLRLYALREGNVVELAYNDDALGLNGDARFSLRIPHNGQYVVGIRDIRFQGGGNHRYRLRIGDFPCVSVPYPMGAKRGTETTLTFGGTDVAGVEPLKIKVPDDPDLSWMAVGAKRKGGRSSGFATLAVSSAHEALEREPNNDPQHATRVTLGANLNGRFGDPPGDVDRFVFSAKKGQRYRFDAVTRRQGSPTDLYLELQNAKGAKLAQVDDTGTEDGAITYTFPADGNYQLVVHDLLGRGGLEFVYRVVVGPVVAAFDLSAAADHVNVPAGGTAAIAVNAARRGYNGPIKLTAVGLPPGVASVPTVLGAGRGSVQLTLTGTAKAKRGMPAPIRIVGTAVAGKKAITATADVDAALKKIAGGNPFPTPVLSKTLVAAVAPPAPLVLAPQPQTVSVVRGKKANVTIKLSRGAGMTEAVTLALTPVPKKNTQKAGLPPGLKVAAKPIPKGKNEAVVTISTTGKAPRGEFTATLIATHKKGKSTVTTNVPGILIQVK